MSILLKAKLREGAKYEFSILFITSSPTDSVLESEKEIRLKDVNNITVYRKETFSGRNRVLRTVSWIPLPYRSNRIDQQGQA
jgi:hypothetical protein